MQGYEALASTLSLWSKQYNDITLQKIWEHFVTFTGSTIPELPSRLYRFSSDLLLAHSYRTADRILPLFLQIRDLEEAAMKLLP